MPAMPTARTTNTNQRVTLVRIELFMSWWRVEGWCGQRGRGKIKKKKKKKMRLRRTSIIR